MAEENGEGMSKEALDGLFDKRRYWTSLIDDAELTLNVTRQAGKWHDEKIYSAAAEYVLRVLTDPSNQEKYGRKYPSLEEIQERVAEEERRFTPEDIIFALDIASGSLYQKLKQEDELREE